MAKVIFVTGTQTYKSKKITMFWRVIWILAAIMFVLFIYRPDWFLIPPGVKFK